MKRLISVLVLTFSFAVFAQGSATPASEKPATEKTDKKAHKGDIKALKGEKHEKEGQSSRKELAPLVIQRAHRAFVCRDAIGLHAERVGDEQCTGQMKSLRHQDCPTNSEHFL